MGSVTATADTLTAYFTGEKQGALVLIALGVLSLAAAALFWPARVGLRSFAVTLGVFAVLELALGVGLYARTDPQVARLLAQLETDPAGLAAAEGARMARVQRTFAIAIRVEVALIVAAAVTALWQQHRPALTGVALGLLIHAALLLAFDTTAERRGARYLGALRAGITSPSPAS